MRVSLNKNRFFQSHRLSIKSSIVLILFSLFLCFLPILVVIKTIQNREEKKIESDLFELKAIIQTGPRKRALPSQYLLQQMGISNNTHKNIYSLDVDKLKKMLISHPVILDAMVDIIPPDTLYVDYTVRDPKLVLGNWENTAVDTDLTFFPLYPYYTPKKLPKVFISDINEVKWGEKSRSSELNLTIELVKNWEDPLYSRGIAIREVDVSHAFIPKLGDREIVFLLEKIATAAQFYIRTSSEDAVHLKNFISYYDANETQFDTIDIMDMRLLDVAYIKYK